MTPQANLREPGAALGLINAWPGTGDGRRCRSMPASIPKAPTRRRKARAGWDGASWPGRLTAHSGLRERKKVMEDRSSRHNRELVTQTAPIRGLLAKWTDRLRAHIHDGQEQMNAPHSGRLHWCKTI
jgi:hypothetical protein